MNGNLRSTFDVLKDLKPQWDKMSNTEQVALGTALAGTNQYKIFSAVMSNFDTAVSSANESLNSAGTTMKQNEVYMQSMEAKLQGLKTEFEKLVLGGDGLLVKLGKLLLDIGTTILKFINSDSGKLLALLTAISLGISGAYKGFLLLADVMGTLGTAFLYASAQGTGLLGVLSLLEINPIVLAVTAFIGVLVGLSVAYDKLNVTIEEHAERLKELKGEYDSATSEVNRLSEELENIQKKIKDVAQAKLNVTDTDQLKTLESETKELEAQEKVLIRQLSLARAKQDVAQKEAEDEAKATLSKKGYAVGDSAEVVTEEGYYELEQLTPVEELERVTSEIAKLNQEKRRLEQVDVELANKEDEASKALFKANEDRIKEIEAELEVTKAHGTEVAEIVQNATDSLNGYDANGNIDEEEQKAIDNNNALLDTFFAIIGVSDKVKEALNLDLDEDGAEDYGEQIEENADSLEDMAKALGITEKQLKKVAKQFGVGTKSAYKFLSSMKEWSSNIDSLQSAYSTLSTAQSEYSENGQLSLDTLQELMNLSPEYLDALSVENGQLQISTEILERKAEAEMQEAEQIIYGIAVKQLTALVEAEVGATRTEETEVIEDETEALQKNTEAEYLNAVAKAYQAGVSAEDIASVQKSVDALKEALKSTNTSLRSTKSSARGAGSGLNEMESKVKSLTSALEKQIEVLKKQKEEAVSAVEKQIKALQKEKDEAVKAIEKQIKALEREKEIREKYWEEQLKNLERENEEREKGLELQKKQEELARAQQTRKMIFKDGQFQYGADETEVSSAQQALFEQEDQNEYEKQKQLLEDLRDAEMEMYEQRIQTLEDYKEQVEEYYDQQIEALEEYKEQLEEEYDAQIEALELLKENITELYENLTEEEKAQLEALLGSETWFQDNSVSQWNSYFSRVQDAIKSGQKVVKGLLEGGIDGTGGYLVSTGANAISTGANSIGAYASGKGSIGDNQLAVVGENPRYREIVIGSKLNNDQGVLMNLKRGSGVVNAGATNTLASLFHQLGGNKQLNANNVSNGGTTISINNITLPEVKNGSDFVEYLQNFALDMTQKAYAR